MIFCANFDSILLLLWAAQTARKSPDGRGRTIQTKLLDNSREGRPDEELRGASGRRKDCGRSGAKSTRNAYRLPTHGFDNYRPFFKLGPPISEIGSNQLNANCAACLFTSTACIGCRSSRQKECTAPSYKCISIPLRQTAPVTYACTLAQAESHYAPVSLLATAPGVHCLVTNVFPSHSGRLPQSRMPAL
ncbi:hypothetical protein J6590_022408 [Homalodisca vitripennis]|nr:hypothetical protein J6590_022408 [Homalodisca vitripennis]